MHGPDCRSQALRNVMGLSLVLALQALIASVAGCGRAERVRMLEMDIRVKRTGGAVYNHTANEFPVQDWRTSEPMAVQVELGPYLFGLPEGWTITEQTSEPFFDSHVSHVAKCRRADETLKVAMLEQEGWYWDDREMERVVSDRGQWRTIRKKYKTDRAFWEAVYDLSVDNIDIEGIRTLDEEEILKVTLLRFKCNAGGVPKPLRTPHFTGFVAHRVREKEEGDSYSADLFCSDGRMEGLLLITLKPAGSEALARGVVGSFRRKANCPASEGYD